MSELTSSGSTLEDVARAAGVSRATASRVVRGDIRVSEQRTRAVEEAVARLGYVPNRAARSLVTRRNDMVALVVPEPDQRIFSDPFFASVVNGLTSALSDTQVQLIMVFGDSDSGQMKLRRFLSDGRIDGAIVASHHQVPGQIETFMQAPIPVVYIGRPAHATSVLTYVDVDNREGGRLAARRLLEAGVTSPAIITGPLDMVAANDRLEGFTQVMRQAGRCAVEIEGAYTRESGAVAAQELVRDHPEIDSLFASSDLMAQGALEVFAEAGIRVPEDVRLVSFDDSEIARQASPPLTSVSNPIGELADEAARMLCDLIDGHAVSEPVILPARLVVRDSG